MKWLKDFRAWRDKRRDEKHRRKEKLRLEPLLRLVSEYDLYGDIQKLHAVSNHENYRLGDGHLVNNRLRSFLVKEMKGGADIAHVLSLASSSAYGDASWEITAFVVHHFYDKITNGIPRATWKEVSDLLNYMRKDDRRRPELQGIINAIMIEARQAK